MEAKIVQDIDWNRVWEEQTLLWRDSAGKSCKEFWADEGAARVYSQKAGGSRSERVTKTVAGLGLTPATRVLDIGAGPGNLALPMAQTARSVTTVEPSPGMNQVMARKISDRKAGNIIQVEKTWEAVDPDNDLSAPYDLVLASMSLGMKDIRAAIEKMNRVCRGRVVVFWHAGIPGWEIMPRALWPKLFNMDYYGGPKSDVLFQVLYQMGIYPEIQVASNRFSEVFEDLQKAKDYYFRRFTCLKPEHGKALEEFLLGHCEQTEQGLTHDFVHESMRFEWQIKETDHDKH
ncbi:class I SAM-dependent methyltransferase [Desulfobacter sp.]